MGQALRKFVDRLIVQLQLYRLHLRYVTHYGPTIWHWPLAQFEIWRFFANLVKAFLLEKREHARQGNPYLLQAGLPHVDTQDDKKKQKGGMSTSMEQSAIPIIKDLVLLGAGHAHAYTLKNLGMKPVPGLQVTVISRDVMVPYSGMLPGYTAGIYTKDECHIDLSRLVRFAGARFIHAEGCGLDINEKLVMLTGGRPPIRYDVLSIDIGSSPSMMLSVENVSGSGTPASITPVKPIDGFSERWLKIIDRVVSRDTPVDVVVVGTGAGGVELCLSMQERLRKELRARGKGDLARFTILGRNVVVTPSHNEAVQRTFLRILGERGVQVGLGCEVTGVVQEGGRSVLNCKNGKKFAFDECIWCTQAGTQDWLQTSGLALDERGFIRVNRYMQSVNTPDVFAAGDCCAMVNPRPKAGVFAVFAGPPLTKNLHNRLLGVAKALWTPYLPQSRFLGIIGSGRPEDTVASKGNMALEGKWIWELKDWIDRKWMAGYTHGLPRMPTQELISPLAIAAGPQALEALAHASMRCGGCGGKVGATVLSNVMRRLDPPTREEVLVGLDSPDDCAVIAPSKLASVQTVDFFKNFVNDPWVFGKIAANHALSDCHAMGAEAVTAMAIAVVPHAAETQLEETLFQMMSGACDALKEANCALVGGHTCEGAELALGFAIGGLTDQAKALTKGGLRDGDALILTKPIGTGVLFAAEMRMMANAEWVRQAQECMMQSNGPAAKCLRTHQAGACTDVTGFGLLGHLFEMGKASNLGCQLFMDKIPLLVGAAECVQRKVFSSLQPANLRLKRGVLNEAFCVQHTKETNSPVYPLLFDPQTAGGLLAGVPASEAASCVAALREMGYPKACVVGAVKGDMAVGVECVWHSR